MLFIFQMPIFLMVKGKQHFAIFQVLVVILGFYLFGFCGQILYHCEMPYVIFKLLGSAAGGDACTFICLHLHRHLHLQIHSTLHLPLSERECRVAYLGPWVRGLPG